MVVKCFVISKTMKIKTAIKMPYPPNQRGAGQVNFRWLFKSPQCRKTEVPMKKWPVCVCVCVWVCVCVCVGVCVRVLFSATRFIMIQAWWLAIHTAEAKQCRIGAGAGLGWGLLLWLLLGDPWGGPLAKLLGNLKLVSRDGGVGRGREDFSTSLGIAAVPGHSLINVLESGTWQTLRMW